MLWGRFALGLLLVLLLQTTLVRFVGLPAVDLFLIYALILAFAAPTHEARVAAFVVGLVQDLGSDQALGAHAFALGVAAIVLTGLRAIAVSGPYGVRFGVALLAAVAAETLLSLHAIFWRRAAFSTWLDELQLIGLTAAISAAAAAYLAPASTIRGRFSTARR